MKIVKKFIVVLLAFLSFVSAFSLVGCTPSEAQDRIVGVWGEEEEYLDTADNEKKQGKITCKFYDDGVVEEKFFKADEVEIIGRRSTSEWKYKGDGTDYRGHYYLYTIGGKKVVWIYDVEPNVMYDGYDSNSGHPTFTGQPYLTRIL